MCFPFKDALIGKTRGDWHIGSFVFAVSSPGTSIICRPVLNTDSLSDLTAVFTLKPPQADTSSPLLIYSCQASAISQKYDYKHM